MSTRAPSLLPICQAGSASGRRGFLRAAAALAALGFAPAPTALADTPRIIDHAWGQAILPRPAQRVVSLGYTTHDTLLALGVVPRALRYWYGPSESGVWPWAEPLLQGAHPEVLRGEISLERVAAQKPDLIVAMGSGVTEAEYRVLNRIAPTLMHPAGSNPYDSSWRERTRILGYATGREATASQLITALDARLADTAARIGSQGKTAAAGYLWSGTAGVYLPGDTRSDFLQALGFSLPDKLRDLTGGGAFYHDLSPEDLSPLDADLLIWVSAFDSDQDLAALRMRRTLNAHREGREIFTGALLAGALSHGSILSIPFALDRLEHELKVALDGDPATRVASAVQAGLAP